MLGRSDHESNLYSIDLLIDRPISDHPATYSTYMYVSNPSSIEMLERQKVYLGKALQQPLVLTKSMKQNADAMLCLNLKLTTPSESVYLTLSKQAEHCSSIPLSITAAICLLHSIQYSYLSLFDTFICKLNTKTVKKSRARDAYLISLECAAESLTQYLNQNWQHERAVEKGMPDLKQAPNLAHLKCRKAIAVCRTRCQGRQSSSSLSVSCYFELFF